MNSIKIKAFAKINLGLDVIRKRDDGYHDVCMIMQTVSLHDTLIIRETISKSISVRNNLSFLPNDNRNLVYKAAACFLESQCIHKGVHIILHKRIPVAAGLAGGSADAAATLIGLNKLFHTDLSVEELMKLGITLGADVPYCILKGTALSEGIGEILTPMKPMPDCTILLVKPNINVSTKYVYENLKLDASIVHPDIPSMKNAIEDGDLLTLTKHMDNILQTVTVNEYPIITTIKDKMKELGALTSLMSGSGPTVFGIYSDPSTAEKAFHYFKKNNYGKQIFLASPYWPNR